MSVMKLRNDAGQW